MCLWWSKRLDTRDSLGFHRIQRFYNTFIAFAALISGLAIGALTFPEFHSSVTGLSQIGKGLFCSSAITAIVSAVVAIMLLFLFEGLQRITQMDLIVAWTPLILLDLSIIEFLTGIAFWFCDNNIYWRGVTMASQLAGLLGFWIALSTWMCFRMSQQGGLGREEGQTTTTQKHTADE